MMDVSLASEAGVLVPAANKRGPVPPPPGALFHRVASPVVSFGIILTVVVIVLWDRPSSDRQPICTESVSRHCAAQEHLLELLDDAFSNSAHPQLSKQQINWVADELYAAGLGLGVPTNLLVFGLGLDSALWQSINCLGRTVFLENYPEWIDKVLGSEQSLEAYKVDYNTSVGTADAFFEKGPWSLDVPVNVSRECFEVILVDAPQGYRPDLPGRMQSVQLSIELARKCVALGRRRKVMIFMHDINRPLEQRIAVELLTSDPHIYYQGKIKGPMGDLSAFEYSNNLRPQSLFPEG